MEQANMMQNGVAAQAHMASMQRPQPGNINQQIFAQILNELKKDMPQLAGSWRATLDSRNRANYIMQLITALRMLEQDLRKCMGVARRFEMTSLEAAQNKLQYEQLMQTKLDEIKQKRAQNNGQMLMNGMPGGMMQQSMMQPPPQMGGMTPNNQPAGFPGQLTRPMQPSVIQQQSQQQHPQTMDPSFLMAQPQRSQPQMTPTMNADGGSGNNMPLEPEVKQAALNILSRLSEDKKNLLRQQLLSSLAPDRRDAYLQTRDDPIKAWALNRARQELAKKSAMTAQGTPVSQGNQQFGSNNQMNLLPQGQANNNNNSSNMSLSHFFGQQANNAMKLQESGEQVVPASANGGFSNQNNGMNMLANNLGPGLANSSAVPEAQRLLQQQQRQQMVHQQNNFARAQALGAQQQANTQVNALSGQPGGLNAPTNFNPGQLSSPAMSMLNRPVQNNVDQQNMGVQGLGAGFAPFQRGDSNALLQHHQNMVNQNTNSAPNRPVSINQQQMMAMLNNMNPELRNKLLSMPPADRIQAVQRLKMAQEQRQLQLQQAAQGQQGQPSGQLQDSIAAQNNLLGIPQPGPGAQLTPEQQLQRQRNHQMLKGQAMLSRPLPRNIGSNLQMHIPQNVQKWGQLRQYIQSNLNNLANDMPGKMMSAMERHFNANPAELQLAMRELVTAHQQGQRQQQAMQQQQQQQFQASGARSGPTHNAIGGANNVPPFMNQQNPGQPSAPTAVMGPSPGGQPRLPPGMIPPTVTDQEIARLRQARNVAPNVSDEQLRSLLLQTKLNNLQKQAMLQQGSGLSNPAMQMLNRAQPPQMLTAPQSRPNALPPAVNNQQALKKPNAANDDVVEIPPPNAAAGNRKPPVAAGIQRMVSQQQPAPTPEQLAKMSKERQQQIAGTQKASAPSMKASPSQIENARAITAKASKAYVDRLYQEVAPLPPKGGPVKAEPHEVMELRPLFKRMWKPMNALDQTLATASKLIPGFTDDRAKQLIRAKWILDQNIADEEGNIKNHLSASVAVLKNCCDHLMRYYGELAHNSPKKPEQQAGNAVQTSGNAAQRTLPTAQPGVSAPMTVTKSQTSNKSSKPPAAPVDDKKFNWGTVPTASPHGVPKYDNQKPDLTPDQLKMPNAKKRKTGAATASQPSTPAQTTTTPTATPKLPAPANAKAMPVKAVPEIEKQMFKCPHMDCEGSISGFDTQAQLNIHIESAHAPIADPFQYLVDATSSVITVANTAAQAAKLRPTSVAMTKRPSKRSSDGTPVPAKGELTVPKTQPATEQSLFDLATEKLGFNDVAAAHIPEPSASDDGFMAGLGDGLLAGLQDIEPLFGESVMDVDDWGFDLDTTSILTPPELTPGGADSDTSHNSDISSNDVLRINMSWDPFNIADDHVPQFLKTQAEMDATVRAHAPEQTAASDGKVGSTDKSAADSSKEVADATWDWGKDDLNWEDFMTSDLGKDIQLM